MCTIFVNIPALSKKASNSSTHSMFNMKNVQEAHSKCFLLLDTPLLCMKGGHNTPGNKMSHKANVATRHRRAGGAHSGERSSYS